MSEDEDASKPSIREQLSQALSREAQRGDGTSEGAGESGSEGEGGSVSERASFEDPEAEVAYWRTRFEQERERLAKLWVAYQDVEAELELRERETDAIAQRKAAAQLAQAEGARASPSRPGDEAPAGEQPGVLAIAPPDRFEVVCEAEERDILVGRGTSFPLVFVNRGEERIAVELSVEDSPETWSALVTEEAFELEAKSSRTIYVLVRPPAEAEAGEEGEVTVTVEPSEGQARTLSLVAEVVGPEDADEADDGEQAEDIEDAEQAEGIGDVGEGEDAADAEGAEEAGEPASGEAGETGSW